MGLFTRQDTLPSDVRRGLPLEHGDRVVSQSLLDDGSWAVATQRTLVRTDGTTPAVSSWCDVDRGSWDPSTATLTITWVDGSPTTLLRVANPSRTAFLRVFRERVQASVVLSETVRLSGGLTARVAVRKDAGGELFTQVVADEGADLSDPLAAASVRSAMSRLGAASGAPPESW